MVHRKTSAVPAIPRTLSLWQRALPWASAGALAIGLALIATAVIALRRAGDVTPGAGPTQFTIAPPENTSFGGPPGGGTGVATQVAVSPDGRNIVFVAGAPPAYQIWLRPVAALAARPIPGTEGGTFPFWSPDSRFIGFFAGGKLKKVAIAGGPPIVLCDAPAGRGGSWSRDNVLLFAPGGCRHRPPARVQRGRGADRRHDPRSGDRRRRPPVAALSARWPALLLHRHDGTLLSCAEAVGDQNRLARPGRRRHPTAPGRIIGVIRLRPCGVRPRRDPDGTAVRP